MTFCGFFPYENPKYTCIVVISDPKGLGPAASSGTVLKNVALKLFARGYLEKDPDFDSNAAGGERSVPTLYSSFNDKRTGILHRDLRFGTSRAIRRPSQSMAASTVPDVTGVGLREALERLESAGYSVNFSGMGFVESQEPAPGTKAGPGTRVKLRLRHLE